MKEILIIRKQEEHIKDLPYLVNSETKYLTIDGKKIAYFINRNTQNIMYSMLVIPGFVASEEYRNVGGIPIIDMEKIVGSEFRKRVISELREKEEKLKSLNEKNFYFWH